MNPDSTLIFAGGSEMLERIAYGSTGLQVSRLCFGTGLWNPRRYDFSPEKGAELIKLAYDLGVNFIDTAVGYQTHGHVGLGIKGLDRSEVVINSKTGTADPEEARQHLEKALIDLGTDYVDVMMLHGVRSAEDFRRRESVLDVLCKAKDRGLIRVVGASTHIFTGSAVRACIDDPRIEVILSLVNADGHGIQNGTYEEHVALLTEAHSKGKAICAMKLVGEGFFADDAEPYIRYGFEQPWVHAVNLGMMSRPQVEMAVKIAQGQSVSAELLAAARVDAKREWGANFPGIYLVRS